MLKAMAGSTGRDWQLCSLTSTRRSTRHWTIFCPVPSPPDESRYRQTDAVEHVVDSTSQGFPDTRSYKYNG